MYFLTDDSYFFFTFGWLSVLCVLMSQTELHAPFLFNILRQSFFGLLYCSVLLYQRVTYVATVVCINGLVLYLIIFFTTFTMYTTFGFGV